MVAATIHCGDTKRKREGKEGKRGQMAHYTSNGGLVRIDSHLPQKEERKHILLKKSTG